MGAIASAPVSLAVRSACGPRGRPGAGGGRGEAAGRRLRTPNFPAWWRGVGSGSNGRSGRRRAGVGRVTRAGSRGSRADGGFRGPAGGSRVVRARWCAIVREDLVDHRGLGDARDDPHEPATYRARERVDLDDLLHRSPTGGLGGRESERPRTWPCPACPKGRLAYQPSDSVVTCPLMQQCATDPYFRGPLCVAGLVSALMP